ncbi:predicted protein [Lichtheimia corymbifera JMRC:FSU:9682]|uniref:F-box domain-containing protein n=1 Tax=Lichtheimia corymbifera JMRC:FSU:9682 TaxID=1263082 RepID=A0A068SEL2_9FUNG|nr:predicted protein [Lichtheimia corymbifera JMRC:FSU:9682]
MRTSESLLASDSSTPLETPMEACGYQDPRPSRSPFTDLVFWPALEQLQGYHLQSLVLDYFRIEDKNRLIDLLKNVRCQSLKLTGVTGACLDFVGIITAANDGDGPPMRHFACHYDSMYPMLMFDNDDDMCLHPSPALPLANTNQLGLVSLALTTQNIQADWMHILQRCSSTLQHIHIDVADPISCQNIMNICPQIQSMFIGEFDVPELVQWPPPSSDEPASAHSGIPYLDTCIPLQLPPWSDFDAFQSSSLKTLVTSQTYETTPDTLVKLIQRSSNLGTVMLHRMDSATDNIWNALMNHDTLHHLSIHFQTWELDPDRHWEWHTLSHRLGAMVALRQLDLVALDGANSIQCAQLFRMLDNIPLVKLRLLSIDALSDRTLETLLPHAPLIEQVDIIDCGTVTTRGIKALINGLPKLRNLTFLPSSKTKTVPDDVAGLIGYAKVLALLQNTNDAR